MAKQRHHRRPKSLGGNSSKANISKVSPTLHQSFHKLFANADPFKIAQILNDTWLDPNYKLIVQKL